MDFRVLPAVCPTEPSNLVFSFWCLVSNGRRALLGGIRLGSSATLTKSPSRLRRAEDLGVKIYDAETCKLSATNNDAELRVQILKSYLQGYIYEIFSKKRLKNKKFGYQYQWSIFLHMEPT